MVLNERRCLFICNTPFHVMMLKAILKKKKIDCKNVDVIYFSDDFNEKVNFYLSNLKSRVIKLKTKIKTKDVNVEIKKIFSSKEYKDVYLASIDSIYTQLIISNIKFESLFTFDDGSANIVSHSSYYKANISLYNKMKKIILGNKYDIKRIKKESLEHYTTYSMLDNIIDNKVIINLEVVHEKRTPTKDNINIVLGSVYSAILKDKSKEDMFDKKIRFFLNDNNAFIICHPRNLNEYKNEIKTNKIIEDFIFELMCEYKNINIYSFCSSSLFFLRTLNNINTYIISSDYLTDDYNKCLLFFASQDFDIIGL